MNTEITPSLNINNIISQNKCQWQTWHLDQKDDNKVMQFPYKSRCSFWFWVMVYQVPCRQMWFQNIQIARDMTCFMCMSLCSEEWNMETVDNLYLASYIFIGFHNRMWLKLDFFHISTSIWKQIVKLLCVHITVLLYFGHHSLTELMSLRIVI